MKQILVQPEQVGGPKKLSQIIREFTFPQIKDAMTDHKGRYCVYGGLMKYFGWDDVNDSNNLIPYREIMKLCGETTLVNMINMNNNGSTFNEIADYLESKQL